MIDINKAEKYFKNNGYDDIIEESKPFCAYYTSMNVWGNEVIVGGRTIDVHIRKLREKIGDDSFKTIKGVGYKFVD